VVFARTCVHDRGFGGVRVAHIFICLIVFFFVRSAVILLLPLFISGNYKMSFVTATKNLYHLHRDSLEALS
jgi:hypothetical protein